MLKNCRAITIHLFIFIFLNFTSIYCQWIKQSFPTTEYLWQVDFCTEDTGWIAGHDFVYKTENAGDTWIAQDSTYGYVSALYALNGKVAFLSSYYDIGLKMTSDGGVTWTKVDNEPYHYFEFNFVNDTIGFVGGMDIDSNPIFRRTFDGGYTWETLDYDFSPSNYEIEGISFIDENTGWAVMYDNYLFKTEDGGSNWTLQDRIGFNQLHETWLPIRDVDFISGDSGWAVGGISGRMLISRTIDGGKTWIDSIYWGNSLREVEFINNRVGWFVGLGYNPFIGKITDGGLTWKEQNLNPDLGSGCGFESISMVNEQTGWAAGCGLYYTNNGGIDYVETINKLNPTQLYLDQNYPNPFNSSTSFQFNLPFSSHVLLKVYNINGKKVDTIIDSYLTSGYHNVNWNPKELPSGLYIYTLETRDYKESKKLLIIK